MKKSSRRLPEVESLESLMLLSTLTPAARPSFSVAGHPSRTIEFSSALRIEASGQESPAIHSTISSQSLSRLAAMGSSSVSTLAQGKGGFVHAMIIAADSKPVVIGDGSSQLARSASLELAASPLGLSHQSQNLKVN